MAGLACAVAGLLPGAAEAVMGDDQKTFADLKLHEEATASQGNFCTFDHTYYLRGDISVGSVQATEPPTATVLRRREGFAVSVNLPDGIKDTHEAVIAMSSFFVGIRDVCRSPAHIIRVLSFTTKGLDIIIEDGVPVDFRYHPR